MSTSVKAGTGNKGGRKRIIAVIAAIIIIGGAAGTAASVRSGAQAEDIPAYREYSVSRGDITVGTTESGTVSIEREYVTFPCSAEVSEVYVKTGSSVKEGDPLIKLSAEDISEAKAQLEAELKSAELALSKAEQESAAKALEAEQTMNSTIEKGKNADSEYELYLTKNEASKASAQEKLESLREELAEYEEMTLTYDDSYAVLSEYESRLEEYDNKYEEMETVYKGYQKTDSANAEAVENLKEEYNAYTEDVADENEKLTELKKNAEDAYAAREKAYEAYISAQESYDSSLSSASDSEGSDDSENADDSKKNEASSAASAQTKLEDAELAYKKADGEYETAQILYSSYYARLGSTVTGRIEKYEAQIEELEDEKKAHEKITSAYKAQMDEYNEEISEYREEYEEYRESFTDIYGNNDADSIAEKIKQLESDISSAELDIRSSQLSEGSELLQAEQQAQSAQSDAESAEIVYEQTLAALESDLRSKQDEYDRLLEEYEEFCANTSDDGVIYAPCSGTAASVAASEGDDINANMTIVTLMDSRYIYLSTAVSEEDITSLSVGQECSVALTAYDGRSFSGEIDTISAEPARSSGSVSYTVTVKLSDESGLNVLEGMSGEITFLEGQAADVLYTNVNAVNFRDGASYVKMYDENGNVVEKKVVTGFSDGRYVEIAEGVSAGDRVLAEIELSRGRE